MLELRLPRAIVAWLVGAALGASGAIIQGLTRNPLASPDLTGVTAGASAAAVILFIFFPNMPEAWLPVAAFGGGIFVALLLYLFAWRGGDSPIRLILVGIGLSAALGAFTSFALTFGELWHVQRAMIWLAGTVYATGWKDVGALVPWLAACLPLACYAVTVVDGSTGLQVPNVPLKVFVWDYLHVSPLQLSMASGPVYFGVPLGSTGQLYVGAPDPIVPTVFLSGAGTSPCQVQQSQAGLQAGTGGQCGHLRGRLRVELQGRGGDHAQGALAADEQIAQIVAGVVLAQAREPVPDLSAGGHHLQAQA